MATNNAVQAAPPRPSPAGPSTGSQHSPLEAQQDDNRSTTEADAAAPDDLDPAAFLKSVRELSEKREREDNERYRRLEEEIEKGRSQRLARREERARSISPDKQQAETPSAPQNNDHASNVPTPSSTRAAFGSPTPLAPLGSAIVFNNISDNMASNEPPQRASVEVPEFKGFGKRDSAPSRPASVSRAEDASQPDAKPSPSAGMPTRSNTMKWQQRPTPRGSRPMSMAAPSPSRETSTDEPQAPREQLSARAPTSRPMSMAAPKHTRDVSVDEPQPSREQIAASLGARDPTYFKQTADRGLGNAAFRKSKDETSSGDDVFAARRGLPGMSKESPRNEERTTSPAPESVTSDTPSRFGSIREDRAWSARSSGTPSVSDGKTSSDLPFRTQSTRSSVTTDTNEPPTLGRTPTMSASQARLSSASDRPPSPTKGMGGFVQSALMKRSDSQTKRWSAQPLGGLQRQDSSASARSGLSGLQGSYSMPKLDPIDASGRESSHEPTSRPSSSSSNLTTLVTRPQDDAPVRQPLPSRNHSRSKSVHSTYSTSADLDGGLKSPLGSPSKRFSPNKSSWIESALARPDSPKAAPSRPAQPSWMENIARAKANRTSVHVDIAPTLGSPNPNDKSRPASPTKETPFGPAMLKRSDSRDLRTDPKRTSTRSITPPTKAKPISLSSRPTSLLTQESLRISERMAAPTTKDETDNYKLETMPMKPFEIPEFDVGSGPLADKSSPVVAPEEAKPESIVEKQEEVPTTSSETDPVKSLPSPKPEPEIVKDVPDLSTKIPDTEKAMPLPLTTSKPSITPKPESSPKPTTDFRSNLRSRPVSRPDSQEKPEFMSKFGTLRKAQQEKYVAPDVLRENITRGKRGLTITEGPQKRERKDELRDSLLAKKEQWQQEKDAGIVHERKTSDPPASPEKPEALATRELLGRNKSVKGRPNSPEKTRNITPEAIRFRKSIREKPKAEAPPVEQAKPEVVESVATETSTAPLSSSSLRKSVTEPLPSPPAKEESTAEDLERTVSLPRSEKRNPSPPVEQKNSTYPPVAVAAPTSKLAARFNPALAGILARGPPTSGSSPAGSRSESPAGIDKSSKSVQAAASEPQVAGAPLADVRKGRAKGPKKRKGGAAKEDPKEETKDVEPEAPKQANEPNDVPKLETPLSPSPNTNPSPAIRPTARFGEHGAGAKAAASIMAASLGTNLRQTPASPEEPARSPSNKSAPFAKPTVSPKPSLAGFPTSQDSPAPAIKTPSYLKRTVSDKPATPSKDAVPEFKGLSQGSPAPAVNTPSYVKRTLSDKPATPLKDAAPESKGSSQISPAPAVNRPSYLQRTPSDKPATPLKDAVPEFKGFGSRVGRQPALGAEEDKENKPSSSPSVKDTASAWGRKKTYMPLGSPSQIQLPTRKDEEAAMRSASLLASSPARSPSRPDSRGGLGISSPVTSPSSAVPPKPAKSSRVVSGQLKEVFPNKDSQSLGKLPETEAERLLVDSFGSWPRSTGPLSIDTRAVVAACSQPKARAKTLRKSIQKVAPDGSVQQLRPQEEYTLFDESVYVCSHTHIPEGAAKSTHVIVWTGGASTSPNVDAANLVAKAEARREGSSAQIRLNKQGREEAELFEALGGIIVTRRGARETASKQFMLRGRKHLGHIAFDEVDFAIGSLCSAFAYLISFPVTLQETKLYLWKGAACSSEEIGAAKLAAMDLSETGEIIEVDQGAEFSSFLKIFGPDTTKASIPQPSLIWQHKSSAPGKFTTRLFNIRQADTRAGIFSTMFRRPSWGMRAPAPEPGVKVEVKEIAPFTQSDLDAEGVYLLDAYGELHLLLGPLFSSLQPENVRNALLAQSLLFVLDYATSSASMEDRPRIPKANVVFRGCPEGVDGLFRGWDDEHGLWGLGGLMAGSSMGKGKIGEELKSTGALDLVRVVCR